MRWRFFGKLPRRWPIPLGILAFIIVVWFARGPIFRAFSFVQTPFSHAGTWLRDNTIGIFESDVVSIDRVRELEAQRDAIAINHAELESLRDENTQLISLLAFSERQARESVSARVVARNSSARTERFVIDRGREDGVEIGLPVIVEDGLFVGKVIEVGLTTSTVLSLSDPSFATAISLLDESRTLGVAQGQLGRLLEVKFIPADISIVINNLVVTSGLEELVPSGLVIGIVTAVRQETNVPFQEAVVEPFADMRRQQNVIVLLRERDL